MIKKTIAFLCMFTGHIYTMQTSGESISSSMPTSAASTSSTEAECDSKIAINTQRIITHIMASSQLNGYALPSIQSYMYTNAHVPIPSERIHYMPQDTAHRFGALAPSQSYASHDGPLTLALGAQECVFGEKVKSLGFYKLAISDKGTVHHTTCDTMKKSGVASLVWNLKNEESVTELPVLDILKKYGLSLPCRVNYMNHPYIYEIHEIRTGCRYFLNLHTELEQNRDGTKKDQALLLYTQDSPDHIFTAINISSDRTIAVIPRWEKPATAFSLITGEEAELKSAQGVLAAPFCINYNGTIIAGANSEQIISPTAMLRRKSQNQRMSSPISIWRLDTSRTLSYTERHQIYVPSSLHIYGPESRHKDRAILHHDLHISGAGDILLHHVLVRTIGEEVISLPAGPDIVLIWHIPRDTSRKPVLINHIFVQCGACALSRDGSLIAIAHRQGTITIHNHTINAWTSWTHNMPWQNRAGLTISPSGSYILLGTAQAGNRAAIEMIACNYLPGRTLSFIQALLTTSLLRLHQDRIQIDSNSSPIYLRKNDTAFMSITPKDAVTSPHDTVAYRPIIPIVKNTLAGKIWSTMPATFREQLTNHYPHLVPLVEPLPSRLSSRTTLQTTKSPVGSIHKRKGM